MPNVSVIIPLWNGEKWIRACLSSLVAQATGAPFALEVIVVDNGSSDNGPALVAKGFPTVRLIRNGRNLGFAGGCNVGLTAATGEILALLNQDTQVRPGWLTGLNDALAEPGVGVAGSLALGTDGVTVQHAGGVVDWPLGVARHWGQGERLAPRWRQAAAPSFVTGASLALRRETLERVGLLDEDFWPGYYEDVDFCWRARAGGYAVRYAPDSVLIHAESASFTDPIFTAWARLRGRLRFCIKHLSGQMFVDEFLPAETLYQSTILAGDRRGQIARAYLEAIPMILGIWQNRGETAALIAAAVHGLSRLCPPLSPTGEGRPKLPETGAPILVPSPLDWLPLVGSLRRALHRLVIFYNERRQRELLSVIQEQQEYIRRLEDDLALRRGNLAD